jgi:hypothetical protein
MAGRRRGTGKPRMVVSRAANRRDRLVEALGRARSPVEQVTAAAAYARAELAAMSRRDPAAAAAVAAELVDVLTSIGQPTTHTRRRSSP